MADSEGERQSMELDWEQARRQVLEKFATAESRYCNAHMCWEVGTIREHGLPYEPFGAGTPQGAWIEAAKRRCSLSAAVHEHPTADLRSLVRELVEHIRLKNAVGRFNELGVMAEDELLARAEREIGEGK